MGAAPSQSTPEQDALVLQASAALPTDAQGTSQQKAAHLSPKLAPKPVPQRAAAKPPAPEKPPPKPNSSEKVFLTLVSNNLSPVWAGQKTAPTFPDKSKMGLQDYAGDIQIPVNHPDGPFTQTIVKSLLASSNPDTRFWDDVVDAKDALQDWEHYVPWDDWARTNTYQENYEVAHDREVTVDFFLNGPAAVTLKPDGAGFVKAEFGEAATLDVIQFGKKADGWKITAITIEGKAYPLPDLKSHPKQNQGALLRFRTRAIQFLTVRDHLLYSHLTFSNYLTQAVAGLPKDDPLAKFLLLHTFGSWAKNSDAYHLLISEKGLIRLPYGPTEEKIDFQTRLTGLRKKFKFQYFQDWVAKFSDTPAFAQDSAYVKNGLLYYTPLQNYVNKYFANHSIQPASYDKTEFMKSLRTMTGNADFPAADLAKLLVETLFRVTYYHNHVGDLLPYTYDPTFLRWDLKFIDEEIKEGQKYSLNAYWAMAVALATGAKQKQMVSIKGSEVFDNAKDQQLWDKFITNLKATAIPAKILNAIEPSVAR